MKKNSRCFYDNKQTNYPFHCSLGMRTNKACPADRLYPTI